MLGERRFTEWSCISFTVRSVNFIALSFLISNTYAGLPSISFSTATTSSPPRDAALGTEILGCVKVSQTLVLGERAGTHGHELQCLGHVLSLHVVVTLHDLDIVPPARPQDLEPLQQVLVHRCGGYFAGDVVLRQK